MTPSTCAGDMPVGSLVQRKKRADDVEALDPCRRFIRQ